MSFKPHKMNPVHFCSSLSVKIPVLTDRRAWGEVRWGHGHGGGGLCHSHASVCMLSSHSCALKYKKIRWRSWPCPLAKCLSRPKCIFSNQRVTHADAEVCAFPQTDFINKLVWLAVYRLCSSAWSRPLWPHKCPFVPSSEGLIDGSLASRRTYSLLRVRKVCVLLSKQTIIKNTRVGSPRLGDSKY